MPHTLIANSGIQLFTKRIEIDTQQRNREWFHEWYDSEHGEWYLELVQAIETEGVDAPMFYSKLELYKKGFLTSSSAKDIDLDDLRQEGIQPLRVGLDAHDNPDVDADDAKDHIFDLSFNDRDFKLDKLENQWLPLPIFRKRTPLRFDFGPFNWARIKLVPVANDDPKSKSTKKVYDLIVAFDTRTQYGNPTAYECPAFTDKFATQLDLELCSNEKMLMDYCQTGKDWSYVDRRIFNLVFPDKSSPSQLLPSDGHPMAYIASYIYLINYLAKNKIVPQIRLFKEIDTVVRDVDMVIDVGNSRTTALLVEDNRNFNQVRPLQLVDYTNTLVENPDAEADDPMVIRRYDEPFDMRLAFRKLNFGGFGPVDGRQFVYPSLVRLGHEAQTLMHRAAANITDKETLSTYSSPKRYLWDWRPTHEEWQFMVLPGEPDDHILELPGVSEMLRSDGTVDAEGQAGLTHHYSRRSLMTFAFLEMIMQATVQINSHEHRSVDKGLGYPETPRRVRRIVITCPTAMSRVEREAMVNCARDAVRILDAQGIVNARQVDIVPAPRRKSDDQPAWFYDEATCSQLVYMYGEVGHKYKGCSSEFFKLYGKIDQEAGDDQPSLTVGSLDIGAGTTDLMISKYTYEAGDVTAITPDPLFYDSFYFAGDDMLAGMVKNIMLLSPKSAFRTALPGLTDQQYRQTIKNFFGPDYNNQVLGDRLLRRAFNMQYSVPLMCHFLELLKNGSRDCTVRPSDVFGDCPPNPDVVKGFKQKTGIDINSLEWSFNAHDVGQVVQNEFEPLLKKIATIMHAYACDIVLLSGRPASLPPVRDIFLKYFAVAPDRLIMLNNYFVGDWYPFDDNTGYITNPKTIVAMGGLIAHYASDLANLNRFIINLDKLKANLHSTVKYIEASREGQPISYFITPEKASGDLTVSRIPTFLNVRQLELDSYPCRALYTIDFNRHKMADGIRRVALQKDNVTLSDGQVQALVNERVDALKRRMPFKLTIDRDPDDVEKLTISSIVDKNGADIADCNVEINIQSLGANERYWLDSGEFSF